ncbi:TRAP transporter small permease [Lentisphaerota bacterium ZTH]|nr:TRAP transporter small permease [Lentisphaerota bacterium]WET05438.1 TRAP transporter small permease [Lentisphaerota bacterium ZTH]
MFRGIVRFLFRLSKRCIELLLIFLVAVLVLDVLWGVFSRYVLGTQSSWTEELARMLLVWVAMLGGSLAYSLKGHLGLDFFVGMMDRTSARMAELVVHGFMVFFAVAVLMYGGCRLVYSTYELQQHMSTMPFDKWVVYLAVPLSGVFFLLFAAEFFVISIINLRLERSKKREAASV